MRPLSPLLLLSSLASLASADSAPKCSDEELNAFGQEYEQCHGRALQNLQAKTTAVAKENNGDFQE